MDMQQRFEQSDGIIARLLAAEGGRITCGRFMEIALTHPLVGYYSKASSLLGHGGHFNTAPGLSPFFNHTVARLVTELVEAALETAPPAKPCVVELGGGEGQLARSILGFWEEERPSFRGKVDYRIVEVGLQLRERQTMAVAEYLGTGWEVAWGTDIQSACLGCSPTVIVGNEFFDALPVNLVDATGDTLRELYIELRGEELREAWGELSAGTGAEVGRLFGTLDPLLLRSLTSDGVLEVRPGLEVLFTEIAAAMPTGSLVTIDYGDWFAGVHSERCGCWLPTLASRRRTLRGYFRHLPTRDIVARPGRQDLTADVDFAALDFHGDRAGFETVVLTTLSAFLRAGGAEDELKRLRLAGELGASAPPFAAAPASAPGAPPPWRLSAASPFAEAGFGEAEFEAYLRDPLECDRQATVLRHLLDEEDLGGAFKVMIQVTE